MGCRIRAARCLLLLTLVAGCCRGAVAHAEDALVFQVEVAAQTSTPAPAPSPERPSETPGAPPMPTQGASPSPGASLTQGASPTTAAVDTMLQVEVIRETAEPPSWAGKRVLIYHTHTWEAYQQTAQDPYSETERWRTKDERHNVVAVGEALAACLRALGLTVVHDTTAFEPPELDTAYARSLTMLEARRAAGERYDLYIDLHRDALSSAATIRRTVNIGGTEVARFMVLVGKGTTGGYGEKPDWEANLLLAERITSSLNGQCEGLARDVKVKTGRFNQHVADCCVLIECGMNTNTLEQVLSGVPYLAQAIADALGD